MHGCPRATGQDEVSLTSLSTADYSGIEQVLQGINPLGCGAAATTSVSDTGWYYVSAVNASTGAGTITACGAA